jgi:hypothetical protein
MLVPDSGPAVEVAPHIEEQGKGVCQMVKELNSPKLVIQINIK